MALHIEYSPKITSAKTIYCEIEPETLALLQMELVRWQCLIGQLDQQPTPDTEAITQWWHRQTNKVSRGHNGRNSPASFVSGIIENMWFKTPMQRDITYSQLEDCVWLSTVLSRMFDSLEPITIRRKLFE